MTFKTKISEYLATKKIITGFLIAFLASCSIYLDWIGFVNYLVNTLLGISAFYLLLKSDKKTWLWTGFWTGIMWFWWIGVSFKHYDMSWAIPISVLTAGLVYAFLFFGAVTLVYFLEKKLKIHHLLGKILFLLIFSYIHPLGFDWYKPELIFTNSYIGIEKWQFTIVLLAIALALYKKCYYYLFIIVFSYSFFPNFQEDAEINPLLVLHGTYTDVEEKWNLEYQPQHIEDIFIAIEEATVAKKRIIVLPESIFAFFLNTEPEIIETLKGYSYDITIIVGGLYIDEGIPRNSTYIFENGSYKIANKVKLVPFGEKNPLPEFMGKYINKIFFGGAPNYVASSDITDYKIDGITYRNAICFEATSEKLYEGRPKNMIILSNNGWLIPSIEPTLQKILLQYYSKKYGTTIYHSVNMSPSYIIKNGEVVE